MCISTTYEMPTVALIVSQGTYNDNSSFQKYASVKWMATWKKYLLKSALNELKSYLQYINLVINSIC